MRRPQDNGQHKGGLVRMGIRGIAGGVGLVSESIKARKESKAAEQEAKEQAPISEREVNPNYGSDYPEGPPPSYTPDPDSKDAQRQYSDTKSSDLKSSSRDIEDNAETELENEWDLDDAQDEISSQAPDNVRVYDINELEDNFLSNNPFSPTIKEAPLGRLSLPVILPQRRPKDRSRGFIRAYAPMLEHCGIDQTTWLSFLDNFQKSSAASPWLNAINLAAIATNWIPSHPIAFAAGYAINKAVSIAIELQARER
jgi:hypothetical protein